MLTVLPTAWDGFDPAIDDWPPAAEATDTGTSDVATPLAAGCGLLKTPGTEPREEGVDTSAGVEVTEASCRLPGTAPVTAETAGLVMTEIAVGFCKLPAIADAGRELLGSFKVPAAAPTSAAVDLTVDETLGSFQFTGKAPVTAIEGVVVDVTVDLAVDVTVAVTVDETARTEWCIPLSCAEWPNGWL
jgi:hypothetical protein